MIYSFTGDQSLNHHPKSFITFQIFKASTSQADPPGSDVDGIDLLILREAASALGMIQALLEPQRGRWSESAGPKLRTELRNHRPQADQIPLGPGLAPIHVLL